MRRNSDAYRVKFGADAYRIVYRVDEKRRVIRVFAIGPRGTVYRGLRG
jgi:mRNA-degrading endonuclease RelE of RelBE toxin-antitoxin system